MAWNGEKMFRIILLTVVFTPNGLIVTHNAEIDGERNARERKDILCGDFALGREESIFVFFC
jgi:hypothetical protein